MAALTRRVLAWAFLSDVVPFYWLYALLFAQTGLSDRAISVLFAIWSAAGLAFEIPAGALADHFSRRTCLIVGALTKAAGFALWILGPGFPGFAAGFVLWGAGGALDSGAMEALIYDGLAAIGAADRFASIYGRITAVALLAQLPAAVAATWLYAVGGFPLAAWVSVGVCLLAAGFAARLPEASRGDVAQEAPAALMPTHPTTPPHPTTTTLPATTQPAPPDGYLATLVAGIREAVTHPAVLTTVIALAALGGFDAIDEYFPLMGRDWGVPATWVPVAVLAVPLAGAAGAALGGRSARWGTPALTAMLAIAAVALGAAAIAQVPAGLAAVAAFYFLYQLVLIVVGARLQERIVGPNRATVTSVAEAGIEALTFGVYAVWAIGGALGEAVLLTTLAVALPILLGRRLIAHG